MVDLLCIVVILVLENLISQFNVRPENEVVVKSTSKCPAEPYLLNV